VEVQERLLAALGKPYVWGGNLKDGVPLLREFYPQAEPLIGVDCSGLLYEATDGFTPRNTSALTSFGRAVQVAGLSPERIAQRLQPLDLIVWKGHVMVVLDGDSIIQSVMGCSGGGGVRLGGRLEVIRNLMKSRRPLDDYPQGAAGGKGFVVRRWFPR
jgi:cell wall-associated NlpC family hydrolase